MKIYHNPRCSKSRCALEWLQEKSFEFEVVDYIKNPPKISEIKLILSQLNRNSMDLIRKNETEFKEFIQGKNLSEAEIIELMSKYPKLIERPIVINKGKAVIARPIEKLIEFITN
jgi:arsenate reductase